MLRSGKSVWDSIGIGTSLLCAIHCVLLPLFISTISFLGIELLRNIYIETGMVLTSFGVGYWALSNGYRIHHRKLWPVIIFSIGMGILLLSNFILAGSHAEKLLKITAASFIITAHVFNWKYSIKKDGHLAA